MLRFADLPTPMPRCVMVTVPANELIRRARASAMLQLDDGGLNIGPAVGDYPDTLNIAITLGGYMLEVANIALKQDSITTLYTRFVDAVGELMPPPILPE